MTSLNIQRISEQEARLYIERSRPAARFFALVKIEQ